MDCQQEKNLAELSHRLTLRLCEELTLVDLGPKPQMTAAMMAALYAETGWERKEVDQLDMEIDKILHKEVKTDPLKLSAMAMQRAATDIHIHLYQEATTYIPAKIIFDYLKYEIAAMRSEQGISQSAHTP